MIEYDYKDGTNLSESLDNLYTIITLLRSKEGCPWDRLQTNKSALESLIDESYEYLDGIIKEDIESEREEIGDVMINVFMTLRIHEENGDFKPEDAVNEVCRKLIRRHPHVFGDKKVDSAEGVLTLWNEVKEKVEGKKDNEEDFFSHIPSSLPPLMEAYEIQKKMKKVGFDWKNVDGVIDKVKEELIEVEDAIKEGDKDKTEEEIGDLLFSVVNLSRFLKIRPNTALKRCNDKIKNRFQKLFDKAKKENIPLDSDHIYEMNRLWETIKKEEKMIKRKGQLYWYDDKSNLSEKHIEYMINEGREKLYNKALDYISSLKNVLPPLVLKDFMWVKTEYTVPYFVDLAFSYKNRLYGILFEVYGKDGMLSSDPLWPLIHDMCSTYDVKPCILPFDVSGKLIIKEGKPFPLLDAEKYYEEGLTIEIDPLTFSSDEMREVSPFEMLSSAVIAEVENLINNENVKEILYHTFPDVYPNIFWIDKNKTLNFMVIETVKERDEKPAMPEEMLHAIEQSGAYGHYALCEFSNPYAVNVFPRGSKFDLRMEITDLE